MSEQADGTVMQQRSDRGFSLIELLLVIVVLGILATIVVAAVGGFTADAEENSCKSDAQVLYMAGEAYFAQRSAHAIPATPGDTTPGTYEATLVSEDFLHGPSQLHDVAANGTLVQVPGSRCTV